MTENAEYENMVCHTFVCMEEGGQGILGSQLNSNRDFSSYVQDKRYILIFIIST